MPRPAPCSLAPGLPPSRRPAPRRLLAVIALVVLLIAAAVPAVSAEIIIDEDIIESLDTSESGYIQRPAHYQTSPFPYRDIYFEDINKHQNVAYIAFTIDGSHGRYLNGSLMSTGTHNINYQLGNQLPKTGRVQVSRTTNFDGTIKSTQLIYFFDDWSIEGLSGAQVVNLDMLIGNLRIGKEDGGAWLSKDTTVYPRYSQLFFPHTKCHVVVASYTRWINHLTVTDLSDLGIGGYDVELYRITSDGNVHPSILNITNGSELVYRDTKSSDFYEWFPPNSIDLISITSTLNEVPYRYPLGGTGGGDPDDPDPSLALATIYVRSSQTGALIAGAHLSILAAAGGTETEVVNQTLPGGTGTFNLEKADYLKYHASATADGYTLLSPILFSVPEEGTTIILWMSPDAPPDVPTEPEKSMLYGYIQTQGSQQPISGATVSLDGYGSTTTSSTGFYLFNNVTPGTYDISASAPLHDALSEPVTVDPATTSHNLALKGHYLLTVTVKDADDLTNLHNTTISLSDGQESTQNPATFTADYGPYTITAAAGGYYPQTQSAYLDKPGTTTATVLLTAKPEPVPPPEMPNYPPHNVKFTIQTLLGTPLSGVNITAQGIQQTPSTNILEALLGLNMTSTPINSELMSGTTDTNGEINFMMVEAVKYQISIYKPDVVNQTLEIYPKEDTYPIIISTAGGPLLPDAGDALRDIHINVTTSTEGDTGHIHIDYNDTTRKTTGLTIQVTQQNTTDSSAPEEVIASHTVANDANVTHTFDLATYKGQSFFVRLEAEHPDFGTVHRDYAVAFKGVRVPLGPLPDGLYIYVAGFGLMLLGGIFGATSATRGVVVIALAGWLFWGFGWLDDLGFIAPVSLGLVSTIAVMGVIVTRYREEGYT